MARLRLFIGLCGLLTLLGCRPREPQMALPTQVDLAALATTQFLTQESPPGGLDSLALPSIEVGLDVLEGWRYEMLMSFEGVFARTTRRAWASTRAEVSGNLLTSARRVVATIEDGLRSDGQPITYEAVLLGRDVFLVRDGACLQGADEDARAAAALGAGSLLGGVRQAFSLPRRAILNSLESYGYRFDWRELILPNIGFSDESQVLAVSGELWYAPQYKVVSRYYLTLELENVRVFGSSLPLTGTAILRYDLMEVGQAVNISVPFGC
ncbi:MAG: hypothetical protein NZ750_02810 [Anaerolineae bacterium]|nr:hypothetical protein [Anaerolineae bacterium]MDW8173390.1 hypothetical protein [Anaerolineae bacterium]